MTVIDLDKGGRRPQIHRTYLGPSVGWVSTDEPTYILYVINGGGIDISVGFKPPLTIPEWVIATEWTLMSDVAGSIQIDVWKIPQSTYLAGTVPTSANSITGTDIPKLVGQVANSSEALTGWTTEIKQNDVLAFNVDSCSNIKRVTLTIQCVRIIGQFAGIGVS